VTAIDHLVHALRNQYPRFESSGDAIWDVQLAAQGLTVFLLDGTVLPLRCGRAMAKQLVHGFGLLRA
jgi:hypothetical protein